MSPRLLLVHAHPDDETLLTGGTMAYYAAKGVEVILVTCTLGEEGEIIPEELRGLQSSMADQLGGYRLTELVYATHELGLTRLRLLGGTGRWRDSGMAGAPSIKHPRAFASGSFKEQVSQLTEIIRDIEPQVVVTYPADGGYGHPDHIRAHDITMAATENESYVARVFHAVASERETERGVKLLREWKNSSFGKDWPFELPKPGDLAVTPDHKITTYIDITDAMAVKFAALRRYPTQITVDKEFAFALSNGIGQPVPDVECFVLARGDKAGAEDDLFGGLEIRR